MLIRFFTPLHHASHDAAAYDSFRLKVVGQSLAESSTFFWLGGGVVKIKVPPFSQPFMLRSVSFVAVSSLLAIWHLKVRHPQHRRLLLFCHSLRSMRCLSV